MKLIALIRILFRLMKSILIHTNRTIARFFQVYHHFFNHTYSTTCTIERLFIKTWLMYKMMYDNIHRQKIKISIN